MFDQVGAEPKEGMRDRLCDHLGEIGKLEFYLESGVDLPVSGAFPLFPVELLDRRALFFEIHFLFTFWCRFSMLCAYALCGGALWSLVRVCASLEMFLLIGRCIVWKFGVVWCLPACVISSTQIQALPGARVRVQECFFYSHTHTSGNARMNAHAVLD